MRRASPAHLPPFHPRRATAGKQIAETTRGLDGPRSFPELARPAEQLLDLTARRAHFDLTELLFMRIDRDRGVRSLVRIDSDLTFTMPSSRSRLLDRVEVGTPDSGGSCSCTSFEPHPNRPWPARTSFESQSNEPTAGS